MKLEGVELKISYWKAFLFYVALVPILPYYFAIKGINVYLIIAFVVPLLYLKRYSVEAFKLKIGLSVDKTICFYALVLAVLSLISGDIKNAVTVIIVLIAGKMIFDLSVTNKKSFLTVIDTILVAALVVTILGAIEAFTSFNAFKLLNTSNGIITDQIRLGITRVKAFTYQAITYGNYLIMVSGLCFYRMVMKETPRKHLFFIITYILIGLNVLCTASRSTIMLYVLVQLVFLWLIGVRKFFKWLFIGIASLGILGVICNALGIEIGILKNAVNLVLAMFFESSQQSLVGLYESTNFSGIGNRIDLYDWVWSDLDGHRLIGMGPGVAYKREMSGIQNGYHYTWYKESIENEYLNCLYHYGVVGLFSEVVFFLSTIICSFKNRKKRKFAEEKIGFGAICFVVFTAYYVSFFAVMQSVEKRLFYILIFMMLCYARLDETERGII